MEIVLIYLFRMSILCRCLAVSVFSLSHWLYFNTSRHTESYVIVELCVCVYRGRWMVLYCYDLLFGLYPSSLCFATTTFQRMVLSPSSAETYSVGSGGPPIEASSIDRTQQSRFHLMTREEPSLKTLWLQNTRTMDKVQIIDRRGG
jgi:hypothetical protein